MNKQNIAVIFGGCSSEYSVSLESASGVISNIDQNKFAPILIGITKDGDWYHFTGEVDRIANDTWVGEGCTSAAISPNRSDHALLIFNKSEVVKIPLDVVLPILHGRNGEDGTVQGVCELAGIPVAGCGILSSSLCMDKYRAHELVSKAGVRVPSSVIISLKYDDSQTVELAEKLVFPLFVKPVKAGSSYGITKVSKPEELKEAIDNAFRYDDQVILEENIPGFEVGCAVMGNEDIFTGELDEIELSDGFFDFSEKYNLISSKIHVPARIPFEKSEEIKETARTIYQVLGCRGFARVDMFLMPTGEIVFNEVNTIPGFTPHSRFPSMMKTAGIPFKDVVTRIIELAVEP